MKQDSNNIVLLHGFMGTTLSHYGKLIRELYGKVNIIGIDLPGHGRSTKTATHDYYQNAIAYVEQKLNKLNNAHLVGTSYLGGTIAVHLARRRPDLITSVVLTGFNTDVPQVAMTSWARNFSVLADQSPNLRDEYIRLHGNNWASTMDFVISDIINNYEKSACITSDHLKQIAIPALLINGDYKSSEVMATARFTELNDHFQAEVLNNAGHIVAHDKPQEFGNRLFKFWSYIL